MRKLFAVLLLLAFTASANEISYRSLQSGSQFGGTPLYDHGLHGEGQILAVLDTGVDYSICYFAEENGALPPINTGSVAGGLGWTNVDLSRRKIIAYDFVYSCDQFPAATYCDDPAIGLNAFDNQGHGTHAAASAVGDTAPFGAHDFGDAIAPAAKLVVQDAGLSPDDRCTSRPGIGCPVTMTPLLDQAYKQGARIHSNSWGDFQGSFGAPPTGNYSQAARDIDAFVASHPDLLVVFNTGNYSSTSTPPASSLSAPGCAKNTIQVGGTRTAYGNDDYLSQFTLLGPSRDGRIKPDLVGPAYVLAGDAHAVTKSDCNATRQVGTSWSSPTIAGAALLVRQYFTDGFYPSGVATPANAFGPSAALMKATLIAAAHRVPYKYNPQGSIVPTDPVPSYEQGFGFPVLDDALYFAGDTRKLRVSDVTPGLAANETASTTVTAAAGTPLKVVLVWTDPAGTPRNDATPQLVNDLDLRVTAPDGTTMLGNERLHPGQPDRLNNVEVVAIETPAAGKYTVTVSGSRIGQGPRQPYALVITGDVTERSVARTRAVRH
jgi:subtilase family protein